MASTVLRSGCRAFSRSVPRVLDEKHRLMPPSLMHTQRFFSSDGIEPIERSMSRDERIIYMELDRMEKILIKNGERLEKIRLERQLKDERDAMYAERRLAGIGAIIVVSGIAGLSFCVNKVKKVVLPSSHIK